MNLTLLDVEFIEGVWDGTGTFFRRVYPWLFGRIMSVRSCGEEEEGKYLHNVERMAS